MPHFESSIFCVSDGHGLRQWWTNAYFFIKSVSDKLKDIWDWKRLQNMGNWYELISHIIENSATWPVWQQYFFAQPFLSLVVFNSITDAAFITWFLKRWFCKSRQFLDITQSKYVIIWWQCLKFVQIFILGCAGQIEVQKCPSLTKFLPSYIMS